MNDPLLKSDPWRDLRRYTPARIAIGRTGASLPTDQWLDFRLAHACARDAVHQPFAAEALAKALLPLAGEAVIVNSQVSDRAVYLRRPDLGRLLAPADSKRLRELGLQPQLALILSDGLSALAVQNQALPLLAELLPLLDARGIGWRPLIIARYGRVALQDPIGQALSAKASLMLLGERPGLGAPDSLGAYLVYRPRPVNTDADRNCVSNIRPEGLSHSKAAQTLAYLLQQAFQRQLSGVALKDDRDGQLPE